jgi:hypothetical protein
MGCTDSAGMPWISFSRRFMAHAASRDRGGVKTASVKFKTLLNAFVIFVESQ